MTDAALFGGGDSGADMTGYGPIPAELARDIARGADDLSDAGAEVAMADHEPSDANTGAQPGEVEAGAVARARVFLRRLFTDPVTGVIENCDPATRSATPRSGTWTTSRPSSPADPPPVRTAAVSASEATTPDKCRGFPSASLIRPGM
jgi:hypothetical protein